MIYKNRYELLNGYWEEPWSKLPKEQRQAWREDLMHSLFDEEEAGRYWDAYSTKQRQEMADNYDAMHDPVRSFVGHHDCSMDARTWFDMSDATPTEAAMVLCRLNPLECKDPERIYVDGDKSSPDRYRLLLRVFEDVARTSPKHRTLMEWRATARERGLRYHSWIDEYVQFTGRDNAATSAKPDAGQGGKGTENNEPLQTANWILSIQAEATRMWLILKKAGASPTKNNILNDLAKWCRENEILTPGGIYPSCGYIERHVLRKWKPPSPAR